MAGDAIPQLLDQIEKLPDGTSKVDLLVVSNGGDPTVAWRAMSLLRERMEHVAVLVPQAAFSAATMLAMGADEIVMHPNGNLGPVDPQIHVNKPGGDGQRFGFQDLAGFLDFAKKEVGLSDQEQLRSMFDVFCKEVGAVPVGVAARASSLTQTMGEKLLRMHMKGDEAAQRATTIAEKLNRAYFHHGYPVSRKEAKSINLQIAPECKLVEDLMWKIWLDIESDLKARVPFSPIYELMKSNQASKLLQPRQSKLPNVGGPAVTQQIIQNIQTTTAKLATDLIREAIEVSSVTIDPVDFEYVAAVMESTRLASKHVLRGKIVSCRMPDLNIQINAINTSAGWESA